jgi:3-oxochol-4-en-24-oyl-CoA dehydrogenase
MTFHASNADVAAFADSARDLLKRSGSLTRLRRLKAAGQVHDKAFWRQIASNGWLGILFPEIEGGLGLGLRELCAVAEQTGVHLVPEPFLACGVQAGALLHALPTGDLRNALLRRLLAGDLLAGVAWQEWVGGDEAAMAGLQATEQEGALALDGRKQFVVGAGADGDGWIVSASSAGLPLLCWVPRSTTGVASQAIPLADGRLMERLVFTSAPVPCAQVLARGAQATKALAHANDVTRIAQGAELLGVARAVLALALAHARNRVQFGKPIGSFQALQHRLVDAYIQGELTQACLEASIAASEADPGCLARMASRVKARAAHAALQASRLAIQVHGAMGFTDECDVGLYFKRALGTAAWLGNAAAHRRRHLALCTPGEQLNGTHTAEAGPDTRGVPFYPRDTDWNAVPEAQFRQVVRRFFAEKFPPELRNAPYRVRWKDIRDWFMTLSRQGWVAPAWPYEHGGMGLPPDKLLAYIEEQERFGVARAPDQGILMLGPLLIRYGTPEQQREYLPRILSGENVWCQGYSEPNAGSDLASLRTEAVIDGEFFVVTGQKIWSTLAHDATHMFMLVRTGKDGKPQQGISFLLVDLATPGITVRPIRDITGHEEFCEVFFDGVRVPLANLVGSLNEGWTMAKALLGFERLYSGSPKQCQYARAQLTELAQSRGLLQDPAFAARYAELDLDAEDAAAAYTHFAEIAKRGEPLPPSVSYLKVWSTETYQRLALLIVEAAQEHGATLDPQAMAEDGVPIDVLAPLFNSTPATIYGGSSEIQRNILAKAVLHLPI